MSKTQIQEQFVTDNLEQLLACLPPRVVGLLDPYSEDILEVILDLGRKPEVRIPGRNIYVSEEVVTKKEIKHVVDAVGDFGGDNRAGIEHSLHRISAIRNRKGKVIGLTCRIGRAVLGTTDMIHDVVLSGRSMLLLGRPGCGKTTKMREIARILSDEMDKRVVIIDTSNEIAGDGDIPHAAIGSARRMQVSTPSKQHGVMIEAVENHMPEVIIIDEIGTMAEVEAARTIAERGVQLIATAHGGNIENVIQNPTLNDLVGGIESVTLGDEEAKRRGSQKTVLERRTTPTFDLAIEIQDRYELAIHYDVSEVVDRYLRGIQPTPEFRSIDKDGFVVKTEPKLSSDMGEALRQTGDQYTGDMYHGQTTVYSHGLSRSSLERIIKRLRLPICLTNDLDSADHMLLLSAHKGTKIAKAAHHRNIGVQLVKSNSMHKLESALKELLP